MKIYMITQLRVLNTFTTWMLLFEFQLSRSLERFFNSPLRASMRILPRRTLFREEKFEVDTRPVRPALLHNRKCFTIKKNVPHNNITSAYIDEACTAKLSISSRTSVLRSSVHSFG